MFSVIKNTLYRACKKLFNVQNQIDWANERHYKKNIETAFYHNFGYPLDLQCVKTFSEKMQWLRVYGNTPLHSKLADKYAAREYVKERIGVQYLVPLLGIYESPDDIDFSSLPDSFVVKCTHGCGYNIIVNDKSSLDAESAKKQLRLWMGENFSHLYGEAHYSAIKPRIIVEKYLENCEGDIYDYKYFCFNGKPHYILYCRDRKSGSLKSSFFTLAWENKNFCYCGELLDVQAPPPPHLQLMNELAYKLCQDFKHVRVDFYNIEGQIYFGEFTFTSYGGYFNFNPKEWDKKLGDLLDLSDYRL